MNRPNSSLDWVLSHWAHVTVLRFIFVYVCILCITVYCTFYYCNNGKVDLVVLKPVLRTTASFSALHCWLGHLTRNHPSYSVFSGTLNPTQSINHASLRQRNVAFTSELTTASLRHYVHQQRATPIRGRRALH